MDEYYDDEDLKYEVSIKNVLIKMANSILKVNFPFIFEVFKIMCTRQTYTHSI